MSIQHHDDKYIKIDRAIMDYSEWKIDVVQKSTPGAPLFRAPHATLVINNMLYVLTRTNNFQIVRFNDPDDLSDYTDTVYTGYYVPNAMCYDSVNNKIYVAVWKTSNYLTILSIDPTTMAATELYHSLDVLGSSNTGPIGTDGTYIYGGNYEQRRPVDTVGPITYSVSGTTVTVTTTANHVLKQNIHIEIVQASDPLLIGVHKVKQIVTTKKFRFELSGVAGTGSITELRQLPTLYVMDTAGTLLSQHGWAGGTLPHAIHVEQYADRTEAYVTGSREYFGVPGKINVAKMVTTAGPYNTALTNYEIDGNFIATDDVGFSPGGNLGGYLCIGLELSNQMAVMHTHDGSFELVRGPNSYGTFVDDCYVYNLGSVAAMGPNAYNNIKTQDNCIVRYKREGNGLGNVDINNPEIYSLEGLVDGDYVPNELSIWDNRLFVTMWNPVESYIMEVTLNKQENYEDNNAGYSLKTGWKNEIHAPFSLASGFRNNVSGYNSQVFGERVFETEDRRTNLRDLVHVVDETIRTDVNYVLPIAAAEEKVVAVRNVGLVDINISSRGSSIVEGGIVMSGSITPIVSVIGDGTTVTITTTNPHNLQPGHTVLMSGWTGGTGIFNGSFYYTVTGTHTFTYLSTGNGTASGGTILKQYMLAPGAFRIFKATFDTRYDTAWTVQDSEQDYYYECVGIKEKNPTSRLYTGGSRGVKTERIVLEDKYLGMSDNTVNMSGGDAYLPSAMQCQGRIYTIKNTGNAYMTIYCTGGDTINGMVSVILFPGDTITVYAEGRQRHMKVLPSFPLQGVVSPVGSVLPRKIGDLYIDMSGPTIYHSYGMTNTDRI